LPHGRGKEPFQYRQTSKMRRPHSYHFDGTSETTEGISNSCFSRAVNPEKRNLKPRFARDDSFRFGHAGDAVFSRLQQQATAPGGDTSGGTGLDVKSGFPVKADRGDLFSACRATVSAVRLCPIYLLRSGLITRIFRPHNLSRLYRPAGRSYDSRQ